MRRRNWIIVLILVAALAFAGALASPYLAFNALAQAAKVGDRDRLEALVDFPAVRASLKAQLRTRLEGTLSRRGGGELGILGAVFGGSIVDQAVDAAVTPEAVAAMVRTGQAPLIDLMRGKTAPPPPEAAPPSIGSAQAGSPPPAAIPLHSRTRFDYLGLNRFRAVTRKGDAPALTWVLGRTGPFSWRLVEIDLPLPG